MAYTQADLDAIDRAIARAGQGIQSVRYSDGRQVNYRTVEEMITVRGIIDADVNPPATPRLRRIQLVSGWDR